METRQNQAEEKKLIFLTFSMASETGSGNGPLFPMHVMQP